MILTCIVDATLIELKFFYVEFAIILFLIFAKHFKSIELSRETVAKSFIVLIAIGVVFLLAVQVLYFIYPWMRGTMSFSGMVKNVTSSTGYSDSGDFNIRVCIKINNRKILSGIAEIIGESDKIVDITVAIDKLDKIGLDNVNAELKEKGISDEAIAKLQPIILLSGTNAEKLATLKNVLSASEVGLKGVEESEFILNTLETMGLKNEIELDLTLARGLNYYTGAIFEVKALDVQIGSITGGGRYDNLTGVFGMAGVSGVGISFGADRIFDVLNQLELYPKEAVNGTELLFINFGEKEAAFSMGILSKVRAAGIRAEIFPDAAKMKKQMSYANTKNIPFVAIVGENEMNEGKAMLKNMETGEQNLVSAEELIATVKK